MRKLSKREVNFLKRKQSEDTHPLIKILSLNPDRINILTQVRKSFDKNSLDILATDIAINGIINMPNIIFYNKENALYYIKIINTLHNVEHKLGDMIPEKLDGEEGYYFLVAGERRSRAFQILKARGCLRCRSEKTNELEKDGAFKICFKQHFKQKEFVFPYKLMTGISPFKVLNIQMSENLYEKPGSHNEASMYASYYKLLKIINPSYTIAKFSRRVARNPNILREFIGYIDLPYKIQKYVENKAIPYGITKELVFLKNGLKKIGKGEKEIEKFLESAFIRALSKNMKVKNFKKHIRCTIENEKIAQISMFEMKPEYRKPIAKLTKNAVTKENRYIKNILQLIEDGFLTPKDEIFRKDPDLTRLVNEFNKTNNKVLKEIKGVMS